MPEPTAPQPPQPTQPAQQGFTAAPMQANLRPSPMESHLAREILNWQERPPKPRVMGEPLKF
ncbi:MAG: hypothetical protein PHU85_15700 [Phycisphaerae bacterium]|nr:hypothetical protein [Phycisphaerae bacterium]